MTGLAVLVLFEQVLSDLKGFRTILVKELFRLKMFILLETRITLKRFSVLFAFFEVFDRFSVLCFLAVLVMSAIFKWIFLRVSDNSCEKQVFLLNKFSVAIRS